MRRGRIFLVVVMAAAVGVVPPVLLDDDRGVTAIAQQTGMQPAPDRRPGEGLGPFNKLAIRGATLIDGTGAPPRGPVDIIVENNVITEIIDLDCDPVCLPVRPPFDATFQLDAGGMYVLPGFVDLHVHLGGIPKQPFAEYSFKLWMGHGVTSVRGVPLAAYNFTKSEKARSAKNEIVAPRIFDYPRPGEGWSQGSATNTPANARAWIRWAAENDVDGFKLRNPECSRVDVTEALLDEARKQGLGSTAHLAQTCVEVMNAIDAARLGLGTVTHFYGHFESLIREGEELFPSDYDYNSEQERFSQVADWVNKIYEPGSPEWKAYLREHLELGTVFDPTFNIYVAGRDVMRMRAAEWHDEYTLPTLRQFYEPNTSSHGSYYWDWGTEIETAWKKFYEVWFKLVKDYHDMGGRITTGSDSGFIYQTYGFSYIMELEMLREAGLTPLEAVTAATMDGAKTLYEPKGITDPPLGTIQPGKLADLIIVPENPVLDEDSPEWDRKGGGFKTLYGTGHVRLNELTNRVERVGGVRWTIKDGIIFDAKQLLRDVAAMVDQQSAPAPIPFPVPTPDIHGHPADIP